MLLLGNVILICDPPEILFGKGVKVFLLGKQVRLLVFQRFGNDTVQVSKSACFSQLGKNEFPFFIELPNRFLLPSFTRFPSFPTLRSIIFLRNAIGMNFNYIILYITLYIKLHSLNAR